MIPFTLLHNERLYTIWIILDKIYLTQVRDLAEKKKDSTVFISNLVHKIDLKLNGYNSIIKA